MLIKLFYCRLQEEDDGETPCFPTRNDRMAFINEALVRERCVRFIENFSYFYFFINIANSSQIS